MRISAIQPRSVFFVAESQKKSGELSSPLLSSCEASYCVPAELTKNSSAVLLSLRESMITPAKSSLLPLMPSWSPSCERICDGFGSNDSMAA